ncbi:MAG: protein phosphatase 2C domain-containing protein, partial [Trueperaceae bacterium]|nr:protein phosphatase 2C domain-containing protein [Trueperaceae bacterium]
TQGAANAAPDVAFAAASRPGVVRRVNQDAGFAGLVDGRALVAVADGIGGHDAGEVASRTAVETVRERLARGRGPAPVAMARAVADADRAVRRAQGAAPGREGMGTTLSLVWIDGDVAVLAHVGDTRAYLLRGGRVERLTDDHSLVAERVRQGLLSEGEAAGHRLRNVITNALGADAPLRIDVGHVPLEAGDRLVVASDGVTTLLDEGTLADLAAGPPEAAVEAILDAADARGSADNVTVALAVVHRVRAGVRRYALPAAEDAAAPAEPGGASPRAGAVSLVATHDPAWLQPLQRRYPGRSPAARLRGALRAVRAAASWAASGPGVGPGVGPEASDAAQGAGPDRATWAWWAAAAGALALLVAFALGR